MVALIPHCVSCERLDLLELRLRRLDCHRVLKRICTVLDPFLIKDWSVRVLVVFLTLDELSQGEFKLRQVFKHHLLEAQMTSVEKDGDQAGIKLYCCLILYPNLELR